jgi:hypothetical protein
MHLLTTTIFTITPTVSNNENQSSTRSNFCFSQSVQYSKKYTCSRLVEITQQASNAPRSRNHVDSSRGIITNGNGRIIAAQDSTVQIDWHHVGCLNVSQTEDDCTVARRMFTVGGRRGFSQCHRYWNVQSFRIHNLLFIMLCALDFAPLN